MADQDGMGVGVEHVEFELTAGGVFLHLAAEWVAMQAIGSLDAKASNWINEDLAAALDALGLGLLLADAAGNQDDLTAKIGIALVDSAVGTDGVRGDVLGRLLELGSAIDALSLGFRYTDRAGATDPLGVDVGKAFADAASASDSMAGSLATGMEDAAGGVDAGLIYAQTYAADYVENEYVGEKFIF